jgi:hypothetical protein
LGRWDVREGDLHDSVELLSGGPVAFFFDDTVVFGFGQCEVVVVVVSGHPGSYGVDILQFIVRGFRSLCPV